MDKVRATVIWNQIEANGYWLLHAIVDAVVGGLGGSAMVVANLFSEDPEKKATFQKPVVGTDQQARLDKRVDVLEEWARSWHAANGEVDGFNVRDYPGLVIIVRYNGEDYLYVALVNEDECCEVIDYGQSYDGEQQEKILALVDLIDAAMYPVHLAEAESRLEDGEQPEASEDGFTYFVRGALFDLDDVCNETFTFN